MVDKLRIGVLSTARIGLENFIPGVQGFAEHCEVVGIASRHLDRAQRAAEALGIPSAYGSYEALLGDPNVDAVYNPLPNHLHAKWSMYAADAGKHVLCEKPIALGAAQAMEMVDHCARAGVVLQEAFMYRFHPQWLRAKDIVESRRIGELQAVQTFFSYHNDDPQNIRNIVKYGGGAVMDIGCYAINLSRWLYGGEPDDVHSVVRRDPAFGTDIVTSAVMRFGTGQSTFTVSTLAESHQRVHIVGSAGRIDIEIPFNAPNDRPTRIFVTQGGDPPIAPHTEVEEFPVVDQYALQADAFATGIATGVGAALPAEDAVANMEVIERVLVG
jgi:predicted dehydrogenase